MPEGTRVRWKEKEGYERERKGFKKNVWYCD